MDLYMIFQIILRLYLFQHSVYDFCEAIFQQRVVIDLPFPFPKFHWSVSYVVYGTKVMES